MNILLLTPSDVLFFRDGRPMSGSLSGHGAAWPLPTVTNAALYASLHRAEIDGVHDHRRGRSGIYSKTRDRKFGSLVTSSPFPVFEDQWLFPRPLDAGKSSCTTPTFLPLGAEIGPSSLPSPLQCPVANTALPSKATLAPWWNASAWQAYLGNGAENDSSKPAFFEDSTFASTEASVGIGIDPATGSQNNLQFYSAHYLRLKPFCSLGIIASAMDKKFKDPKTGDCDLIKHLFPNSGAETPIITGGQQRLCTVRRDSYETLPLPIGKTSDFEKDGDQYLVKWILLSPAIFPQIKNHPGGWLPSWIDLKGKVQLLDGPGQNYAKRHNVAEGNPIGATLVAAMTGKPVPVSGYALESGLRDRPPGPKPTHLAVPAGSVYYFSCDSPEAAAKLANALNWHGTSGGAEIKNRRSTIFGEKGFGLGVCGTWNFHNGKLPSE